MSVPGLDSMFWTGVAVGGGVMILLSIAGGISLVLWLARPIDPKQRELADRRLARKVRKTLQLDCNGAAARDERVFATGGPAGPPYPRRRA